MVFIKVWLESWAIARFSQLDALIWKIWFLKKNHWAPAKVVEVIFKVAEAKFWISSSFYKFSFRIFVVLDFEVVWPRRLQRLQKGVWEFFQKLCFWNQCIPVKKMSYVPALRSKFFTKSLHRGGVWKLMPNPLHQYSMPSIHQSF